MAKGRELGLLDNRVGHTRKRKSTVATGARRTRARIRWRCRIRAWRSETPVHMIPHKSKTWQNPARCPQPSGQAGARDGDGGASRQLTA